MMRFWVTSLKDYDDDAPSFEFDGLVFDGAFGFGEEPLYGYEGPITYLKDGVKQHDSGVADRGHRTFGGFFFVLSPHDPSKVPVPPFLMTGNRETEVGFLGTAVVEVTGEDADITLSREPGEQLPVGGAGWFGVATMVSTAGNRVQFGLQTFYTTAQYAGPRVGEIMQDLDYADPIGPIVSLHEHGSLSS